MGTIASCARAVLCSRLRFAAILHEGDMGKLLANAGAEGLCSKLKF